MAKVENGVLINVDATDVERLNKGASWKAVFGPGITRIGKKAFSNCSDLRRLPAFPEGLELIDKNAFYFCYLLKKLPAFPKSLKSIKEDAFFGCASLAEVTIPNTIVAVADSAFATCSFQCAMLKKDGRIVLSQKRMKAGKDDIAIESHYFDMLAIKKDKDNSPVLCANNQNGNIDIVSKSHVKRNACSLDEYNNFVRLGLWNDYVNYLPFLSQTSAHVGVEALTILNGDMYLAERFFKSIRTGYDVLRKKEWYSNLYDDAKENLIKLFLSLGGFESKGQKQVLEVIDDLHIAYGETFNEDMTCMFLNTPSGEAHLWGRYGEEAHHCFSKSILNFFVKNKDKYNSDSFKSIITAVVNEYPMIYQSYRQKLYSQNPDNRHATNPNREEYEALKAEGITCDYIQQYLTTQNLICISNENLANTLASLPQGVTITQKYALQYQMILEQDIPKIIEDVKSGRRKRNKNFINQIDDGFMVLDDNPTGVHYEWAEINKTNALTCGEFMQTCFRPYRQNRYAYWNCIDMPNDTFMMLYDGGLMMGYCRVRYYPETNGIMVDNIELSHYAGMRFTSEKKIELAHSCEKGLLDMAREMNAKGFRVDKIYAKQDFWADVDILEEWKKQHTTVDQVDNAQPMEEIIYDSEREHGLYHATSDGPQIILHDIAIEREQKNKEGVEK